MARQAKRIAAPPRTRRFPVEMTETPFEAVACVIDLENFTAFTAQDGATRSIGACLSLAFELVSHCLNDQLDPREPFEFFGIAPAHFKFLGDGALFIWPCPTDPAQARLFFSKLMNGLHQVRYLYPDLVPNLRGETGYETVPKALRLGIAKGPVYRVTRLGAETAEFLGVPINLAARLQGYCAPLGFMASARGVPEDLVEAAGFVQVTTRISIKGFASPERVFVDRADFEKLSKAVRRKLFRGD